MANKKYTAAQLRAARKIIDQEEAIEYERERRTRLREARRDKEDRITYTPKPMNPRLKRSLSLLGGGLLVMWLINGFFGLYAVSGEDGLYRRVVVWLVPLLWTLVIGMDFFFGESVAAKPLTREERRWAKEFNEFNHGRRATAPKPLGSAPKPQKGKGDWFEVKEVKDSGQGDYS